MAGPEFDNHRDKGKKLNVASVNPETPDESTRQQLNTQKPPEKGASGFDSYAKE